MNNPQSIKRKKTVAPVSSSYKKMKTNLTHERDQYRNFFLSSLKTLIPKALHPHKDCPVLHLGYKSSKFSCILPLIRETKLRMVFGSNRLPKEKKKGGETQQYYTIHRESIVEVTVPVTFCILFYYNRTIHGGGPSEKMNVRMFGVYAPIDVFGCAEEQNYTRMLRYCNEPCDDCTRLRILKESQNGNIIPSSKESNKLKLFETLNDFDLKNHGFCIVKVADVLSPAVANQAEKIGNGQTKGIKFKSIGQEELNCGGTRNVIDKGSELCPEHVMSKRIMSELDKYLSTCRLNICAFLETAYTGTTFQEKGRNLVKSNGNVGYQTLHLDGTPDCTCT